MGRAGLASARRPCGRKRCRLVSMWRTKSATASSSRPWARRGSGCSSCPSPEPGGGRPGSHKPAPPHTASAAGGRLARLFPFLLLAGDEEAGKIDGIEQQRWKAAFTRDVRHQSAQEGKEESR